uniref:NAD-dependent epimerase/dehydratase domain-containing protein n=1 Tax=Kalanchoe fedtschenkoi TaxID=63787 RepID=A0A7N0UNH0_KALFE
MAEKGRVCVTGAGGFVGSWLVKLLLSKGFVVHATVRDPSDKKNAHLQTLDNASEKLKLFKADVLDYQSVSTAVQGCVGVFHVASPIPSPALSNYEVEMFEPVVKGTLNVLRASNEANIKRVVIVSSVAAVIYNPAWPEGKVKDESCWSDKDYCRNMGNALSWYALSKAEAEFKAFEYGDTSGIGIVTVCPALVIGPILQSALTSSSWVLFNLLKEGYESVDFSEHMLLDVRDLAEALVLAYEKPEAEGRYICASHSVTTKDFVGMLQRMYPSYKYPQSFKEGEPRARTTSEKLQKLGWSFRPLEETLADSVESYRQAGLLLK